MKSLSLSLLLLVVLILFTTVQGLVRKCFKNNLIIFINKLNYY